FLFQSVCCSETTPALHRDATKVKTIPTTIQYVFRPMSDSFQVRRRPILAQLVVFSPNDLFDDRLCDLIPMLCPAAVTNPDGDFGTTKDIALIGPLAETDRLIASSHAATLAKIGALHVVCIGHGPHRSSPPHLQRSTSVSRPCVNYFTQSAQIRHAVVWISFGAGPLALNAQRPPITGVPDHSLS